MKSVKIVILLSMVIGLTACLGGNTGKSKTGNQFDYAACESIRKGQTMAEVKTALKAEPTNTGKLPGKGWIHHRYYYQEGKNKGLNVGSYLPGVGGAVGGTDKSDVASFECNVYYSNGKVIDTTYHKAGISSTSDSGSF